MSKQVIFSWKRIPAEDLGKLIMDVEEVYGLEDSVIWLAGYSSGLLMAATKDGCPKELSDWLGGTFAQVLMYLGKWEEFKERLDDDD